MRSEQTRTTTPPEGGEPAPAAAAEPAEPIAPAAVPSQEATSAPAGPDQPFGRPGRPFAHGPFVFGFLLALGALVAYGLFQAMSDATSILMLVFIALFLAVGLHPVVVKLRDLGLPRWLAVTAVSLGVLLLIGAAVVALVPPVVAQVDEFSRNLPDYLEALTRSETLNEFNARYDIINRVKEAVTPETIGTAFGGVVGGAKLIFGTIFNSLTVLILTIYFMGSFDKIKGLAYGLVPASRRNRVQRITDEILAKVGAYMVGALAIAVLAGLSTWVFAMIAGLAVPFALAVVVALCDLIPQIGATLGAVVVSVVGFAASIPVGIACVIFFVVYQQIENYLIYPLVMRRSVNVSDVAAIVAALLGVALLGVIGALIAIPAVAAIQLILREVVFPRQNRH